MKESTFAGVGGLKIQSEIDGLICESFAYDLPVPDIVLSFLKGLSYITKHTHVFTLKNEIFARDPQVVDAMNNDPLIHGESQPVQTAKVMIDAASLVGTRPDTTYDNFAAILASAL